MWLHTIYYFIVVGGGGRFLELCWKHGAGGEKTQLCPFDYMMRLSHRQETIHRMKHNVIAMIRAQMWEENRRVNRILDIFTLEQILFLFTNIPDHQQTSERRTHWNSVRYLCFFSATWTHRALMSHRKSSPLPGKRTRLAFLYSDEHWRWTWLNIMAFDSTNMMQHMAQLQTRPNS